MNLPTSDEIVPFTPMIAPPYTPMRMGDWEIRKWKLPSDKIAGYWTHSTPVDPDGNWVLVKHSNDGGDPQVWMSLTPMELESQGYHARLAKGNVLVAGLGMGVLVYNLLLNREVEQVTVVEQSDEVIQMFHKQAARWPRVVSAMKMSRLLISHNSAFTPVFFEPIDLLIADIWQQLGTDQAEPDTLRINDNVKAPIVSWWGQEHSIIDWCISKGWGYPVTREQVDQYQKEKGITLLGADQPAYPFLVSQTAVQMVINLSVGWKR